MRSLLLSIALLLSISAHADPTGVAYNYKLTRVIDGDTVAFTATFLPPPLKKELSLRIYGVDTPEKGFRAKCDAENQRGLAASEFTKNTLQNAKRTQVVIMDWDKYGGRVLGDILVDGVSLRSLLIGSGHARAYFGEAKGDWCK